MREELRKAIERAREVPIYKLEIMKEYYEHALDLAVKEIQDTDENYLNTNELLGCALGQIKTLEDRITSLESATRNAIEHLDKDNQWVKDMLQKTLDGGKK